MKRPDLNKTFFNFLFGFLALVGLAFGVLMLAGAHQSQPAAAATAGR